MGGLSPRHRAGWWAIRHRRPRGAEGPDRSLGLGLESRPGELARRSRCDRRRGADGAERRQSVVAAVAGLTL
jgi:hypothetical protein